MWGCGVAKQEASPDCQLAGQNGDTVESLRELIAVPPRIEALLRPLRKSILKASAALSKCWPIGTG